MPESAIESLINNKEAFDFSKKNDAMFLRAIKEAFFYHYKKSKIYRRICQDFDFAPENLITIEDIAKIPYILVNVFKKRKILSVPQKEINLILTSSGTGGEKSKMYLDKISLSRIKKIIKNVFQDFKMVDYKNKTNYLCFTYDIRYAKNIGTAFSDKLLSELTPINEIYYALEYDKEKKDFYLNFNKVYQVLEKYGKTKYPLRILGFPSFFWEAIKEVERIYQKKYSFGEKSFIVIGGGWKTMQEKEIPKEDFKRSIEENLGIPQENIRDVYGLVEHGIPYVECEKGKMHVPIYSRAFARDPETLKIKSFGEAGMIQLITPYLRSLPAISILTSDLGRLNKNCLCKRNSPYLEILGRGGTTKYQGCAIKALEYLK
ncbi:MAG: acyl-protein synthetase [Armatimonadetes bacterium]|nr:acyl-protein synthetase [Armatimonadota bacterium]